MHSSTVHASVDNDSLAHRESIHLYLVPSLRQELGLNINSLSVAVRRADVGIKLEGPLVNADSEYASLRRIAEKLWTIEPFAERADTIAIAVTAGPPPGFTASATPIGSQAGDLSGQALTISNTGAKGPSGAW